MVATWEGVAQVQGREGLTFLLFVSEHPSSVTVHQGSRCLRMYFLLSAPERAPQLSPRVAPLCMHKERCVSVLPSTLLQASRGKIVLSLRHLPAGDSPKLRLGDLCIRSSWGYMHFCVGGTESHLRVLPPQIWDKGFGPSQGNDKLQTGQY